MHSVLSVEALDAAHGHAHAEDGSELTEEDSASGDPDDHGHAENSKASGALTKPLMIYAGLVTLFALVTTQMLLKRRQKESEASDA